MNYSEGISELIDRRIGRINSISLGVISKVNLATWSADVRLKMKIQDQTIEIVNVPIALQTFAAGAVHIAPAVNDVVVIGFSKHELKKQLRNRDIVTVNELVLHNMNHAIILTGVHVESDAIPVVAPGEILIGHKSGSFIKFKENGDLELTASHIILTEKV